VESLNRRFCNRAFTVSSGGPSRAQLGRFVNPCSRLWRARNSVCRGQRARIGSTAVAASTTTRPTRAQRTATTTTRRIATATTASAWPARGATELRLQPERGRPRTTRRAPLPFNRPCTCVHARRGRESEKAARAQMRAQMEIWAARRPRISALVVMSSRACLLSCRSVMGGRGGARTLTGGDTGETMSAMILPTRRSLPPQARVARPPTAPDVP